MTINPQSQLGLARDRAEELRLTAAACGASRRLPRPRHDKENLMSATQDWTAHTGDGPARYQRLLVPAIFDPCARKLVAHARVRPGMRVLDVACGTGAMSRVAARATGPTGS